MRQLQQVTRPVEGRAHVAACTDPAPSPRERIRVLIESVRFERAITALVVANAIALGLETSLDFLKV